MNMPAMDKNILDGWEKNDIFGKSIEARADAVPFVFYEGPPGTNGLPHIGHATTRMYKDSILRYNTMKGRKVLRKAGWDTHGLPVERKVENDLGLANKFEVERTVGIDTFVAKCKETIATYESQWRLATKKLGFWVNFDEAYRTCDDEYIESVWWALKKLFDQGDIYEGYRVSPYCPRCGTTLANHEVAQGYISVKDKTLFARFKAKAEENTYFIAWTTTPWTLPANVALCVNPTVEYAKIRLENGEQYYMAKCLIDRLFEEYTIVETMLGQQLEGMEYEPLFVVPAERLENKKVYFVTCGDYVTTTDGSGIVHIAPAHGDDDAQIGRKYNLPTVNFINQKGCFDETFAEYAGKRNIEANLQIIADLKARGMVVKEQTVEHEYPHCWRCKTPLISMPQKSWFVSVSKHIPDLVKNNNDVDWHPANVKDGRMGNFLNNALDWNLSRDRFWGTPLNIWRCETCGKLHSVGSRAELNQLKGNEDYVELHKPFIDKVTFPCECGGTMRRVPQLIDVWFDSGCMPFAQWHYPFENKEIFEEQFPANFISEGQDQTRGWFYTLQVISTLLFNKTPYKAVVMCGLVNDKNGVKMSKSLGNVVDPDALIDKYGADAVRLYFFSNSAPWLSQKFNEEDLAELQRKTISTLWNTYSFFVLYANIAQFDANTRLQDCALSVMDKWLLSQLNALTKKVDDCMTNFNFTDSTRAIIDFVENLSNWYIRRSRERFGMESDPASKQSAFATLHHTLVQLSKIAAPFMPFVCDEIYQNLTQDLPNKKLSVHLEDYPTVIGEIDKQLNIQMQEVIDIVTLGRACRNDSAIKNRQPLSKLMVYSANKIELTDELMGIIADDLNVKTVEFIDNAKEYISFELKPQLKTLGPKYGKELGTIREFLAKVDAYDLVTSMQQDAGKQIIVNDNITLSADDILVYPKSKPNCCAQTYNMITVILDTTLTDDLIAEGNAREFVSKVQNFRKELGLAVEDRVRLGFVADDKLAEQLLSQKDLISRLIVITSLERNVKLNMTKDTDINGIECTISIEKVE